MSEQLADLKIERDGDDFVVRVKSRTALAAALAALALLPIGAQSQAPSQAPTIDRGRESPATDATGLTREADDQTGDLFGPLAPAAAPAFDPRSLGAPLRNPEPPALERAIDNPDVQKRDKEIADAYAIEGLSVRQCRTRFSCNQRRVEMALQRQGVEMRDRAASAALRWARGDGKAEIEIDRSAVEARDRDFRKRYEVDLLGVNEIAKATETSAQIVTSALKRMGVKMRSVAEAQRIYYDRRRKAKEAAAKEAAIEEAVEARAIDAPADRTAQRAPQAAPSAPKPAPTATKPLPAATPAPKPAKRLKPDATIDEQMAARYRDDGMPISELVREFGCGVDAVKSALKRQQVEMRTPAEALRLSYAKRADERERQDAIAPKPKPLAMPANPPIKTIKLAEANAERGGSFVWNSGPKPAAKPMNVAEQQAAIDRFFQEGGAITRIESAPIEQTARPAVGGRDGRRM